METHLSKILEWLRAGYPEGVSHTDYSSLFALLGTYLTDEEIAEIGDELSRDADPSSAEAIRNAIADVSHHEPTQEDIVRVKSRLAAGGWPLAKLGRNS
jgi:hypothetical protein